jgi:hypothetical protein
VSSKVTPKKPELDIPPALLRLGLDADRLQAMEPEQIREIVKRVKTLGRHARTHGPQTDDELHAYIKKHLGVDIPRTSVCEDHDPPFKFIADVYFERLVVKVGDEEYSVQAALALANRGGSKTHNVAIVHYLNSTFKPGCGCLQFGATEQQGKRCYENIEDWCYEHDENGSRLDGKVKPFILGEPMRSETKWRTGSKVEVVAGSEKAVSGPHPQKAGADEVDQMDRGVWNQSRGMAVAKQATGPLPEFMERFNGMIPPQDIVTSTRNSRNGLMQELLDEVEEDIEQGNIPLFAVFIWCIFETIAEVPNCRGANKDDRERRLAELGRDPCELCTCNKVVKGRWEDGKPRTLEEVCQGKAFKSRGWKPYVDFVSTFKRNTPGTWLLQHECREGEDENNYIKGWTLDAYGVHGYEPKPEYGRIYQGIDWGGTNPHAVLWFQYLTVDVPCLDFKYNPIFLQAGIYVLFKEIYVSGIDAFKLAHQVKAQEDAYRAQYGNRWRVVARFMDPQGRGERIHFGTRGMKGVWPIVTRDKATMITTVQNVVIDDRFAVDVDGAPMFCEEVEVWQKDPKTDKEIDTFNHTMAAWRYGIANSEVLEGKRNPGRGGAATSDGDAATRRARKASAGSHTTSAALRSVKRSGPVSLTGNGRHPTDQFKDPMTR